LGLIIGGGAAERRGLRLRGPVYLIGWRRRWRVITFSKLLGQSVRESRV
jgi:hypothetical protein